MKQTEKILDQLQRAYAGEAWHGPSLRELLAEVTAEQAAARPLRNAHTIWEIVLHVATWKNAVRERLESKPGEVPEENDWPPVTDTSPAAWSNALNILEKSHEDLRRAVIRLTEAQLDSIAAGRSDTLYFNLHGAIQHDLYHAGQVALLKKA